jgi:2,5-dioxopentanoate dehydrogenase
MNNDNVPVLVNGEWRASRATGHFQVQDPSTGKTLPLRFPVSSPEEVWEILQSAHEAVPAMHAARPEQIAGFLEELAAAIERRGAELVDAAHAETGLPKTPRLKDVELPRTTDQLRQAAAAARDAVWRRPILDEPRKIYSMYASLGGPVVVMGPNNFPFAFNSAAGGDFAAAIVAQNPVIAKANTGHPNTTRIFVEIALECLLRQELPAAGVQLCYRMPSAIGLQLVAHPQVGATAFTGSKQAGLSLKRAADEAGKPIYLEMSSVNPVVVLPGALKERGLSIAREFFGSCTLGSGQFCTNPGLLLIPDSPDGQEFQKAAINQFTEAKPGVLLNAGVQQSLVEAVDFLRSHGAELLCGGRPAPGPGFRFENTLLRVSADQFLRSPEHLQTEAFGPVSLIVTAPHTRAMFQVLNTLEGNLTGTIYSDSKGADDLDYKEIELVLRRLVGRLINDRMPTGVAVSPAMNHGGPFPATGHPGFTAVGLPASVSRFAVLHCYDNVPPERLPQPLRSPLRTANSG